MTVEKLRGEIRVLIGNPNTNDVPDRELDSFIIPSLTWFANETRLEVITDEQVPVVANQLEYVLPKGFAMMYWVSFNGNLLTPVSTWFLNRNLTSPNGANWRTATPGLPQNFAIEGRKVILNPPADTSTATSVPFMAWRYIGTGDYLIEQGTPELSDLDQQIIRYDAAVGWLSAHPSDENAARIENYKQEIERRFPLAKQRWENSIANLYKTFQPDVTGRFVGAR